MLISLGVDSEYVEFVIGQIITNFQAKMTIIATSMANVITVQLQDTSEVIVFVSCCTSNTISFYAS